MSRSKSKAKPKTSDELGRPVARSKWEQIRAAERVIYDDGKAKPVQLSWREREVYQPGPPHRSSADNHPSVVMGKRVWRPA